MDVEAFKHPNNISVKGSTPFRNTGNHNHQTSRVLRSQCLGFFVLSSFNSKVFNNNNYYY